jgi:hypothetical protein
MQGFSLAALTASVIIPLFSDRDAGEPPQTSSLETSDAQLVARALDGDALAIEAL